jgi:hypothetical protein
MGNYFHKYSDSLGKPNVGIHSTTLLGFAINDFLLTILSALLLSYFFNFNPFLSFLGLFLTGEMLHYIFGVNTRLLNKFGIEFKDKTD